MLPLLTDSLVPEKGEPLCPVQPLKCYHKPLPFQISAWSCGIEFVFVPHQECSGPCCSSLMMSGSLCGAVVVYTRQKPANTSFINLSFDVFSYTGIRAVSSGRGLDYYILIFFLTLIFFKI